MKEISVCVPVLRRYDLLRELLLSLLDSTVAPSAVYVIDNGGDGESLDNATKGIDLPVSVLAPDPAYGLAKAWNWFLGRTAGEERIISNDDIKFGPKSLELMIECESDLVFPVGIGFSCFLLRDSCIHKAGLFDESLSPGFAYFEDCDYMNRITEYNKTNDPIVSISDVQGTGIVHYRNGTQRAGWSRDEIRGFRQRYYIAQENFIRKWGSLPAGLRRITERECAA